MSSRQTSSDERDDRQAASMGSITAKLEAIEMNRGETREILRGMSETLTVIREAIARMVVIQESTEKRLQNMEDAIGDETGGLAGRLTKTEGLMITLDSDFQAVDRKAAVNSKRLDKLEDRADSVTWWIIGTLVTAVIALLGVISRFMGIGQH